MAGPASYRVRFQSAWKAVGWLLAHSAWIKMVVRVLQVVGLIMLVLIIPQLLIQRVHVWLDDLRYGRPRTMQLSTFVGHNEHAGQPSHFIALNLNRRIIVIELPGGDSAKTQLLTGPYLFGAGEDLTPVTLHTDDINKDSHLDLVISVKREELIYINTGDTFRLITDDERKQLLTEEH